MTVLLTGATGLIGGAIVERLVRAEKRPILLVRRIPPRGTRLYQLSADGLVKFVEGDLARDDVLGLDRQAAGRLAAEVTQVIHCAAYYRLNATAREVTVNYDGTRRLLDVVTRWPVSDFHHVSSILAAGVFGDDWVPEAALPRPQRVRNAYELSKWKSEQVAASYSSQVAIRIYRPGIVIGDSVNGNTTKFDGPYPAFRFGHRLLPVLIGAPSNTPFPLVTVDLVADIICGGLRCPPPRGTPEYINIIDLCRPTLQKFAEEMAMRLVGHRWVRTVPGALIRLLARMPGFVRVTGLEREALDYMGLRWQFRTGALERLCAICGVDPRRLDQAYDAIAGYYALQNRTAFYPGFQDDPLACPTRMDGN